MGLATALVAAIAYVLIWEAYLAVTHYAFIDKYFSGPGPEMEALRAQYRNPLLRTWQTFQEIAPAGLVVALISAGLLRDPENPAGAAEVMGRIPGLSAGTAAAPSTGPQVKLRLRGRSQAIQCRSAIRLAKFPNLAEFSVDASLSSAFRRRPCRLPDAQPGARAAARPREQAGAYRAMQQGRVLSLTEIRARIRVPGAQYIGVEVLEGMIYRLKFMRGADVIWIDVDPRTGRIVARTGH